MCEGDDFACAVPHGQKGCEECIRLEWECTDVAAQDGSLTHQKSSRSPFFF